MISVDPTVRGEELGHALRELRERKQLSLADVAARIDLSVTTLSRMENGKRTAATEDVAAMLAIYRTTGPQRARLLALAREVDVRGWWQPDRPPFAQRQQTLISLESRAVEITNFEGMAIPGLLQTGEYSRAMMIESGLIPGEEVEGRMVTRLRRHSVLLRDRPPHLIALIDELALHRIIGGPDVVRRQLDHLIELSARPNIDIRVIPNGRTHAGINGAFTVLRRREGEPVVFLENLTSSLFLEERDEVERYQYAARELLAHGLGAVESAQHIAERARALDVEGTHPDEQPSQHADLAQEQL